MLRRLTRDLLKSLSVLIILYYSVIYTDGLLNKTNKPLINNKYLRVGTEVSNLPTNKYILGRTVKIENIYRGSQATGTYIRGGYILTVRHLYSDDNGFHNSIITTSAGKRLTPLAIYLSGKSDMVILVVSEKIVSGTILGVPGQKEPITLVGNPGDRDFEQVNTTSLVAPYIIRDPETNRVRMMYGFVCNGARPGFSGSGIFNDSNEMVGMMTLKDPFDFLCLGWTADEIRRNVNEMDVPGLKL